MDIEKLRGEVFSECHAHSALLLPRPVRRFFAIFTFCLVFFFSSFEQFESTPHLACYLASGLAPNTYCITEYMYCLNIRSCWLHDPDPAVAWQYACLHAMLNVLASKVLTYGVAPVHASTPCLAC